MGICVTFEESMFVLHDACCWMSPRGSRAEDPSAALTFTTHVLIGHRRKHGR